MLVVIIRDGKKLSTKASFIIKLLKSKDIKILYLFRNEQNFFQQKNKKNKIYLPTTLSGILLYYTFFMIIKSPKDLCNGLLRRIHKKQPTSFIRQGGFLTIISQTLYQRWVRRSQEKKVITYLRKTKIPKIFIIDEFFSLKTINLTIIKNLGKIIYVSSDFAYDFYSDNLIASKMMYALEKSLVTQSNLTVTCSERDKLKYEVLGVNNTIFYPNLYPDSKFHLAEKEDVPSICLVLREHWGKRSLESLNEVMNALSYLDVKLKLYSIGIKPSKVPSNVDLRYYDYIPSKLDFLQILSKSWIGINLGIHFAGTNERKYDYALSGLVVMSDIKGIRGDFIPNEFAYVDCYDLAAKLNQIFQLDKKDILRKGLENRNHVKSLAKKQHDVLLKSIKLLQNEL